MPGKFKDESASKCITEFVGLRSKMYSFMFDDKKDISKAEVRVAKGVQKSDIFNDFRFSTYLNCLWNDEVKEHNFKTICRMKQFMTTYTQSKIMLCPFEDKIFVGCYKFFTLWSLCTGMLNNLNVVEECAHEV